MANKTMKTLTMNNVTYEIVDETARNSVVELQEKVENMDFSDMDYAYFDEDATSTEGTSTPLDADTLGGVSPSGYVKQDELTTAVNNIGYELDALETNMSDNYVLKTDIDKLSNSAQIDLEGGEDTGETILSNSDLLAGMTYQQIMDKVYPIGRVIMTFESEDPNVLYSWQTWERTANGKFLLGADDSYAVGSMGGSLTHSHSLSDNGYAKTNTNGSQLQMHSVSTPQYDVDWALNANSGSAPSGSSQSYAIGLGGNTDEGIAVPPYLAVNMWKRTA